MESIPAALTKSLGRLGLSAYEAQVYAALVMFGHPEVKEIVEFLAISKPSVYRSAGPDVCGDGPCAPEQFKAGAVQRCIAATCARYPDGNQPEGIR